jgi:hypothetical protein
MDSTELGGFEVSFLVVGIVQVIKNLLPNMSGRGVLVVALSLGIVLFGLAEALPFVGESASIIILAVVRVLGYATAIPGWFSVATDEVSKMIGR